MIGAGLTGMATAARLAVRGRQVTVFEAHRTVGGTRLTLRNSNQRAVPHDLGIQGWIQAGDTTWPGLGTTACAICSEIAADDACRVA